MLIDYSDFLLSLRKQRDIDIRQITRETGIDQFRYLDYENGRIVPSEKEVSAILSVYNLNIEDVYNYVKERKYYPVVFSKKDNKYNISIPTFIMLGASKEVSGGFTEAYNESVKLVKEFLDNEIYIPINPHHIVTKDNEFLIMVKYN